MNPEIKKILVPIDFSDYSKNAFRYSIEFCKCFESEIILIYVIEPVVYPPDFSMGQIAFPTVDMQMDKRALEELEKLAKSEIPAGQKIRTIVKTGKPFIEIIDTAVEEDVDLIIISSHGHSGVQHIIFGSTAEKVVRKASCPVLTVRDPVKGFSYKDAK
ncbi:MAG: universal stress protein [Bacteroidota bacterium]|nr:universal stress protein [Bacteroidota bacterium]